MNLRRVTKTKDKGGGGGDRMPDCLIPDQGRWYSWKQRRRYFMSEQKQKGTLKPIHMYRSSQ